MELSSANRSSIIRVRPSALLEFYDRRGFEPGGDVSAITGVAGEELGIALLCHYLEHQEGVPARLLDGPCSGGKVRGSRLDGWLRAEYPDSPILYQVEVKNWSAHSLSAKPFPQSTDLDVISEHRRERWRKYIWDTTNSTFWDRPLQKVLQRMSPPEDLPIEPVACLWISLHPEGLGDPWFQVDAANADFPSVRVFSMSSYLRQLNEESINLEMPRAARRIRRLLDLFPLQP